MALSVLDDKSREPTEADLAAVLGRTKDLWDGLVGTIESAHTPVTREWNYAGKPYGWSLRLIRRKRTILYLIPQHGHFLSALVFGGKATAAVRESDLPAGVIAALDEARVYAEGRGLRLPTRTRADATTVVKLAAIKMAH